MLRKLTYYTLTQASDNGVEMISKKISAFSETMPWESLKLSLDEADYSSSKDRRHYVVLWNKPHASVRFILNM